MQPLPKVKTVEGPPLQMFKIINSRRPLRPISTACEKQETDLSLIRAF